MITDLLIAVGIPVLQIAAGENFLLSFFSVYSIPFAF